MFRRIGPIIIALTILVMLAIGSNMERRVFAQSVTSPATGAATTNPTQATTTQAPTQTATATSAATTVPTTVPTISATPTATSGQTTNPTPPYTNWSGRQFRVKSSIPFAWICWVPNSNAPAIYTVYPGQLVNSEVGTGSGGQWDQVWDGAEWWGYIQLFSGTVSVARGYVELKSLEPVTGTTSPTPTVTPVNATPAPWTGGMFTRVKASVPFAWLRTSASSHAPVRYQTNSGVILSILGNDRAFDGFQFWWPVRDILSGAQGWVEQNSLEAITFPPTTTPGTPPATVTPERWNVFARVRVKLTVPFSWLRNVASS